MWKVPYYNIETGIDWENLDKNCEWFRDMKTVPQDNIWHAEGNVQIHTIMVTEALLGLPEFKELNNQDKHIMVCGALMHDIEKRSTTKEEFKEREGRICVVAPKHANKGEYTARLILYKEWNCPFNIREQICNIVRYHGNPLWDISDDDAEQRTVATSMLVKNSFLCMIAKADILGRICDDSEEQLDKVIMFGEYAKELGCWDKPKEFTSNLARFKYLSEGGYIDYNPFNDRKFKVYMMSAIPGSGKDTYIKRFLSGPVMVSLDDIRIELNIKPTDKKGNGNVIQLAKERAKECMRRNLDFVWNATNLTTKLRGQLIDLFISYGGEVTIIYVEVPYNQMMSQNKNRTDVVPDNIINRMLGKLEIPNVSEAHNVAYFVLE